MIFKNRGVHSKQAAVKTGFNLFNISCQFLNDYCASTWLEGKPAATLTLCG